MSSILRQATVAARQASRARHFSSTPAARKDLIQDFYLREIKVYKPTPVAKDAHVGVVKQFALPPSPKAPTVPADLASELSAYDASEPSIASASSASAETEAGGTGASEFLHFLEQDLPKAEHGHH